MPSTRSRRRRSLPLKIRHADADGEDTPSTKGTIMAKRFFHSRMFLIVAVGLGTILAVGDIVLSFSGR